MTTPPLGPRDPDGELPDFGPLGGRLGDQLRGDAPLPFERDPLADALGGRDAERRAAERRAADRRNDARRADRRAGERRAGATDADSYLSRMLQGTGDAMREAERDGIAGQVIFGTPSVVPIEPLYYPLTPAQTALLVREALHEDEAFNDVTTLATVLSGRHARGRLVAREPGVLAGVALAIEAFRQIDPRINVRVDVLDGGELTPGMPVLFLSGHARGILSAERVALNFLQRLSGIASLTSRYVKAVTGTQARILDTRKTTPGWRKLEKFAVRAGGGMNHRMDLATAVLIKDNHLAAVDGDVSFAVRRARDLAPEGARVEVECDTRAQVEAAVAAGADVIMLDNMTLDEMRASVQLCAGRAITEASGGVRLDTVRGIAETGVDWISVGALTHSAPALDLALDFE
ncbi:MAG: carboxylating nicotinate-nucleotide diphosphorylase [Gemmatirosa sp.]